MFGLDWVCFRCKWVEIGFVFGASALKMGLIGFELALFFFQIAVFGAKSGEIGFVLHKKVFLCALVLAERVAGSSWLVVSRQLPVVRCQ